VDFSSLGLQLLREHRQKKLLSREKSNCNGGGDLESCRNVGTCEIMAGLHEIVASCRAWGGGGTTDPVPGVKADPKTFVTNMFWEVLKLAVEHGA